MEELQATKEQIHRKNEKIQLSKEKCIWGLTSRVPFKDTNRTILGTVVMTRDITNEKLFGEELEVPLRKPLLSNILKHIKHVPPDLQTSLFIR